MRRDLVVLQVVVRLTLEGFTAVVAVTSGAVLGIVGLFSTAFCMGTMVVRRYPPLRVVAGWMMA